MGAFLGQHPPIPSRGGHPPQSNLVRGKLTSPTPNPAGDGAYGSLVLIQED